MLRAWLALPFIWAIRVYQFGLSPFLGRSCRFEPSCSEYSVQCLKKYGVWRGLWLAMRRVGRCHPWHPGGYDPVP